MSATRSEPPTGADLDLSWLDQLRGVPFHGDLVVTDLAGVERVRYPSGHDAHPSPDSQWLAYWRSNFDGRHNLFVARPAEATSVFVGAVTEAEPGSGASFSTCWSADSRTLQVQGSARNVPHFSWRYDVISQQLYLDKE